MPSAASAHTPYRGPSPFPVSSARGPCGAARVDASRAGRKDLSPDNGADDVHFRAAGTPLKDPPTPARSHSTSFGP
jgi:hypothetical protein